MLVYFQALQHHFLTNWDDLQYVLENQAIRGITPAHLREAFTRVHAGNYAPLHIISYMIDYELWGLNPAGFIGANVLLHTVNGVIFYLLLCRIAWAKPWVVVAALIFLVHPVQVESVAWVSERKNLLAMLFYLLAFHCYLSYKDENRAKKGLWYGACLALFVCALLSKSVAVIFPLMLLLYDICLAPKGVASYRDKVPFVIAAAAIVAMTLVTQQSSMSDLGAGRTSYHGGSAFATFLTMLPVFASYLRMLVWPSGLSAIYSPAIKTSVDGAVFGAAMVCLGVACIGAVLWRSRRDLFFWYSLFILGLLPVAQIVPIVTLMNDRYLYFPLLGAAPCIALATVGEVSWTASRSPFRVAAACGAVVALACLAFVSYQRVQVWQSSYTLWKDTVQKAPRSATAHDGYGEGLLQRGALDEALGEFKESLQLQSSSGSVLTPRARASAALTHNNLGTVYGMKGMTAEAVVEFSTAVQLNPEFDKPRYNLGIALAQQGRLQEALESFIAAARLKPDNPVYQSQMRLTQDLLARGQAAR
ncbi:tetratricopeptide repeat protein [Geomonas nitrogeniifigens]|nr:tetratricopeptide repeat protein [Geomonas nitrogeniifigens]